MNNNIIQYRRKLFKQSKQLREAARGCKNFETARVLRKYQNDAYHKWKFIRDLSLAMEKQKEC